MKWQPFRFVTGVRLPWVVTGLDLLNSALTESQMHLGITGGLKAQVARGLFAPRDREYLYYWKKVIPNSQTPPILQWCLSLP